MENKLRSVKQNNTVRQRQEKQRAILLEQLEKVPIVQIACDRSSIARTTYYRWLKEDKQFKKVAEAALTAGEALINDMSESQLIALIRDKNFSAVRYWLDRHHPKYGIERNEQKLKAKKPNRVTFKIIKY